MRVAFNQDASCCVTGTEHGFRVYNCSPFGKFYTSDDDAGLGGVGLARMLFSTSLVAVVGNGELNSPRRLAIVNTRRRSPQAAMCELTFPTTVRNLLLNRQRLVVVLDAQIYIYNIANMKLLYTLETVANRGGVASITPNVATFNTKLPVREASRDAAASNEAAGINSPLLSGTPPPDAATDATPNTPSQSVSEGGADALAAPKPAKTANNWLVYPAGPPTKHHLAPPKSAGDVPKAPQGDVVVFDLDNLTPVTVIRAHRSPVALLALNEDGTLLATTSDKGTLIRVFAVPSGTLLYELRRGSYQSKVYSLAFSLGSKLLCVSSATQTVHIYKLDQAHRVKHSRRTTDDSTEPEPDLAGDRPAGRSGSPETADTEDTSEQPAHEDADDGPEGSGLGADPDTTSGAGNPVKKKAKKRWFSRSSWAPAVAGAASKSQSQKRDFAWFKVPVKHNIRTAVGMAPLSNLVYVTTESGKLFHYAIDMENGGECTKVGEYQMD